MNYGDVLGITFSIIGFLLSLQGLWLLCRALWPRRVARAAERCRRNGVACFFTGIPVIGLTLLIGAAIGKRGGTPGQLIAWILATVLVVYCGVGMSGFVTFVGERLASPADAIRPWRATVRGGIAVEFAYLLPVIGWFGLLPATLILGAGAATLSFFGRSRHHDLQAALSANRDFAEDRMQDLASSTSVESMS